MTNNTTNTTPDQTPEEGPAKQNFYFWLGDNGELHQMTKEEFEERQQEVKDGVVGGSIDVIN